MKDLTWGQCLNLLLQLLNLYCVYRVLNYRKQEVAELKEQNKLLIQGLKERQIAPAD